MFGVTACLIIVKFVVYPIFASGEEQPWNKDELEDDSASNHEAIELHKDRERKA